MERIINKDKIIKIIIIKRGERKYDKIVHVPKGTKIKTGWVKSKIIDNNWTYKCYDVFDRIFYGTSIECIRKCWYDHTIFFDFYEFIDDVLYEKPNVIIHHTHSNSTQVTFESDEEMMKWLEDNFKDDERFISIKEE